MGKVKVSKNALDEYGGYGQKTVKEMKSGVSDPAAIAAMDKAKQMQAWRNSVISILRQDRDSVTNHLAANDQRSWRQISQAFEPVDDGYPPEIEYDYGDLTKPKDFVTKRKLGNHKPPAAVIFDSYTEATR